MTVYESHPFAARIMETPVAIVRRGPSEQPATQSIPMQSTARESSLPSFGYCNKSVA